MAVDYLVKIEIDVFRGFQYFQWTGHRLISNDLDDAFNKPKIEWRFGSNGPDHVYTAFLRIQTDIPNDMTEEEAKKLIKLVIESYGDEVIPPVITFIKIPESFSNQDIFKLFMF